MNWVNLWAKLEVISIIFSFSITAIVLIIYIILFIKGGKK